MIVDEGQLVKWAEVEPRCDNLCVRTVVGLADVLDHYAVAVGKDDMVLIKPLKVLNRLFGELQQELRHVDFGGVPDLKVRDCALRKLDGAKLVLTAWDPACLAHVVA